LEPSVVPTTFAETVQDELAARVPALSESTAGGPVAATATPPQVLAKPDGVAKSKPAVSVSVNARALNADALGFVIVMVKLVVPVGGLTKAAPKALVTVGGTAAGVMEPLVKAPQVGQSNPSVRVAPAAVKGVVEEQRLTN
jgi:hypothetical protein